MISRILITRMKYIGDVVLTTPVIRSVREAYPDAFIAYLGDQKGVSLLERNPHVNEIIPFDFSKPTFLEQPRVIFYLRKKKFDVVIDLFCNPRSALISYLSGAPMRIGKDVKGRGRSYTHRITDDGSLKSAIAFHYQYVRPLGVEPSNWKTEIFLSEDEKREAKIFLKWHDVDVRKPIIAVHPGATWPNKMWLKESFASLINKISGNFNVEVILSQGPGDEELKSYLEQRCRFLKILPLLPVRQLAAVLSQCAVFVTNDCGPMHIGVAVGTKTLGIFGPEPPEIWFPYDAADGHLALFRKISCSPCRQTFCHREPEGFLECMNLITVDEVFEEVGKRL
jgi:heptosyltransferase-3